MNFKANEAISKGHQIRFKPTVKIFEVEQETQVNFYENEIAFSLQ